MFISIFCGIIMRNPHADDVRRDVRNRCSEATNEIKAMRCDLYTHLIIISCATKHVHRTRRTHRGNIRWWLVHIAVEKDCVQSDEPRCVRFCFCFSSFSVSLKSSLLVFRMWFSVFICSIHFWPFDAASGFVSVMRHHPIPETVRTF